MGTRLYFDMSDARRIPNKIPSLMKELGDSGRLSCPSDRSLGEPESSRERRVFMPKLGAENPENWSIVEVRTSIRFMHSVVQVFVYFDRIEGPLCCVHKSL